MIIISVRQFLFLDVLIDIMIDIVLMISHHICIPVLSS